MTPTFYLLRSRAVPCWRTTKDLLLPLYALLFALACTSVAQAAPTYIQGNYSSPQSGQQKVTVAFPNAQSVGNVNVVVVAWNDDKAAVQSVSDSSGNTYRLAGNPLVLSGIATQAIYYSANIANAGAGANTVTVVFTAAAPYPDIRIAEYSGIDVNTPLDVSTGATGTGTYSDSGSVATSSPNELLIGANYVEHTTSGPGSGYTQRLQTDDQSILEDTIAKSAGSYNVTAPIVNGPGWWLIQMAALRPAASTTDTQAPTAPAGLSATAVSGGQVSLSWTAATDNVGVSGYRIERCQGSGCQNFVQIATSSGNSYNDAGVAANTSYVYRVRASDAAGNLSSYSATAALTTPVATDTQAPTAPTQLIATAASSDHVTLTWSASTDNVGVTGYAIERCSGSQCSSFTQIAVATGASYDDSGLSASTRYSYRVRGTDAAGNNSGYSNIASVATAAATTAGSGVPLPAYVQGNFSTPQNSQASVATTFTAAQTAGNLNVVVIGWNDSSTQIESVTDSSGNAYQLAAGPTSVPGNATQAIYYASGIAGSTASSNSVTVTFTAAASWPDVRIAEYSGVDRADPIDGGVEATGNSTSSNSGVLSTRYSNDLLVAGNYVEHTTTGPGTGFSQRMITPDKDILEDGTSGSTGNYSASAPLTNGQGWWVMQMVAFRGASGTAATGATPPTVPASLTATATSSTSAVLRWSASSSAAGIAGYQVFRGGIQIATTANAQLTDSSLASSTTYQYTVASYDNNGLASVQSAPATVTTPAAPIPSAAFPLRVQSGGRYLVDANGTPFLLQGDNPSSIEVMLTSDQVNQYLDDRKARGFNTILFELMEHKFATSPPYNVNGDAPFTGTIPNANGSACMNAAIPDCWDFSTPNEAYWRNVDSVISAATARGFLVMLFPAYIGYEGGAEGWYQDMLANGTAKLAAYGNFIGNRYKNYNNILWVEGGDYIPANKAVVEAVANGIRNVIPAALQTAHASRGYSALDVWAGEPWLNVNDVYAAPPIYTAAQAQYANSTMPFFLIEGYYENDHGANELTLRSQAYQALLSGAFGQIMGNNPLWFFGSGWQQALGSPGAQSMAHLHELMSPLAWWRLVPDSGQLIVAGQSSGGSFAAASTAADGSFAVIYDPGQALGINLAHLGGPHVKARWFDPSNGAYVDAVSSVLANSGTITFTPPGNNGNGYPDWILLLQSVP